MISTIYDDIVKKMKLNFYEEINQVNVNILLFPNLEFINYLITLIFAIIEDHIMLKISKTINPSLNSNKIILFRSLIV